MEKLLISTEQEFLDFINNSSYFYKYLLDYLDDWWLRQEEPSRKMIEVEINREFVDRVENAESKEIADRKNNGELLGHFINLQNKKYFILTKKNKIYSDITHTNSILSLTYIFLSTWKDNGYILSPCQKLFKEDDDDEDEVDDDKKNNIIIDGPYCTSKNNVFYNAIDNDIPILVEDFNEFAYEIICFDTYEEYGNYITANFVIE